MYSSIIKKTCKCGCGKLPSLGYMGYFMDCRPDLKEEKIVAKNLISADECDFCHIEVATEAIKNDIKNQ